MDPLRQLMLTTLEDAGLGVEEFHRAFLVCSARFEHGEDAPGLEEFRNLLPRVAEFSRFCNTLNQTCVMMLPDAPWAGDFERLRERFNTALSALTAALQKGDLLALGEALRLDLCPALHAYARLFTDVRSSLSAEGQTAEKLATCPAA